MKKLDLSIPSERIIGFTIPRDGHFYVCDHDEVWTVQIGPPLTVEVTDLRPYDFVAQSDAFIGWGDDRKLPILKRGDREISYDFDPTQDYVTVHFLVGGRGGEIEFQTLSGDWFSASFSEDGRYLVLAEPYGVEIYDAS